MPDVRRSAWRLLVEARAALGGQPLSLPERVRQLVTAQDVQSERLVGWLQLGLMAVFWGLYLIAPRPADARMSMLTPVPLTLLLLASLTVLRLAACYRGTLPDGLLMASIATDIFLLLALIWAFHLQYGQPAAFSLKVPTFTYLFVLIALRALRFNPKFVLTAGLSAAAGWATLAIAVVLTSPPGTVTRDFVAYVTGNAILVGAELDKILALLLVTAVLALGAVRARRTLQTAVREQTAAREIGRFLSRGVADVIAASDNRIEAGHAAERDAAIIMLDIRGFTRFSTARPPADVVRVLSGLHARVLPLIQLHGGVVDKFLGDGIMATFGAVTPTQTPKADAVRALVAIMDEAARWRDETGAIAGDHRLEVNGALASGPVVFATLGSGERLEYTVIGEAVNLAAKLEKHNKSAGTRALVDGPTYDRALAQGYVATARHERRPNQQLHGVDAAMDIVVLCP